MFFWIAPTDTCADRVKEAIGADAAESGNVFSVLLKIKINWLIYLLTSCQAGREVYK